MYCRKWDSKKKLCYYKAKTRKLEADKAKNIECGLQEVEAVDAQSQLALFCEILDDVCSYLGNKNEIINKTFINIKNLM